MTRRPADGRIREWSRRPTRSSSSTRRSATGSSRRSAPDGAAGARLAGDRARRVDADPLADGQRQDAGGVPLGDRPLMFSPVPAAGAAVPRPLRLAAQGARGGRRAQPAVADCRHRGQRRAGARRHVRRARRVASAPATRPPRSGRVSCATPADILITTPESLYLLLTSRAREVLRAGRDGHRGRDPRARADQARRAPGAVARAARGALRASRLQRIGLSATQRPLDEVARFLGGAHRQGLVPRTATGATAGARGRRGRRSHRSRRVQRGRRARRVPPRHGRRRAAAEAAGADGRGAGRGPGRLAKPVDDRRAARPSQGRRRAVDLVERSTRACSS